MSATRVVVVGGSLASLRACETLRERGYAGEVVVVSDERGDPYDRPPLSKKVLAGEWDLERVRLRSREAIAALDLDRRDGVTAVGFDAAARRVELDDGTAVSGDGVIIATGASPRLLPGQPEAAGIHVLRSGADALTLAARLVVGQRLVVVGGGFIGLEAAATARQTGLEVVVLEGGPAPMARAFGDEVGRDVASVHARHGVAVHCSVAVSELETEPGPDGMPTVRAVRTADGQRFPADTVLVAVGVAPNVEWLRGSGVALGDGVICDDTLAAAPGVFAAGDCARWVNPLFGDPPMGEAMRVEHWTNAAEQGAAAAANLLRVLGGEQAQPFESVPFVWSDQFDSRIQFVGRPHPEHNEIVHLAGDAHGPFAVLYGNGGRLRAALGVSMPKLVMPFRALLARRAGWDEALELGAQLAVPRA